jgi:hypothetical protein
MNSREKLEAIADELISTFGITVPPVPIETILANPKENMWNEVNVSQMSGTFFKITDRYSPRMSIARMLVRHILQSPWGSERKLGELLKGNEDLVHAFARMLVMPSSMVTMLTSGERNPTTMSIMFEVPEVDARQRLQELI